MLAPQPDPATNCWTGLTALLEDHFRPRGEWHLSLGQSLQTLQEIDPETAGAFETALAPAASLQSLERLVKRVTGINELPTVG